MTMKSFSLGAIAFGVMIWTGACAKETPIAPSSNPVGPSELSATSSAATMGTMATTSAVVTLQPDLTATPASVTVPAWTKVSFVNNSGRFVTLFSYNCSEFDIRIPSGYYARTTYLSPGRACDYFAWDVNWSRQIFVGQVVVQ